MTWNECQKKKGYTVVIFRMYFKGETNRMCWWFKYEGCEVKRGKDEFQVLVPTTWIDGVTPDNMEED